MVDLHLRANAAKSGNKISLNIPQSSLNLPRTRVIPERASVALVAGGFLAMGPLGRRRVRQSAEAFDTGRGGPVSGGGSP